MPEELPISEIISRAGGHAQVATICGVDRTTPYSWDRVPAQHMAVIARAIGVPMQDLRPDLFAVMSRLVDMPEDGA